MKLVHLVGFIIKKFVTMHGHMNVKSRYISTTISDAAWQKLPPQNSLISQHPNFFDKHPHLQNPCQIVTLSVPLASGKLLIQGCTIAGHQVAVETTGRCKSLCTPDDYNTESYR